jgi:hypothetical protein
MCVMEHHPQRYYWYRVGYAHVRCVRAESEDAARAAVLARNPHAQGQRIQITPAHWPTSQVEPSADDVLRQR